MSTRWSPNIVACVGDFAVLLEEDGKLISTDCTNSAKPAGLRGCGGDQVTRVAYMRVW